jgi:hypothetical protein
MRNALKILLVLMAMLTAGCATTMIPVGPPEHRLGSLPVDVLVGQEFPHFDRSDPFTPIHITLRNNTKRKVDMRYSYFSLVDPEGRVFIIAPVDSVASHISHEYLMGYSWYQRSKSPRNYVFREGRLQPDAQYAAVAFFHQATLYGQGVYTLRVHIPENRKPIEFTFRLK